MVERGATDRWASGDLYEPYVGRWSSLVARELLAWLDAPGGLAWLDVGCGTGALTEQIARRCSPARLAGIDPSAGFLALARRRLHQGAADLRQGDARTCRMPRPTFDRVVSGLVLNFVPDRAQAAAEMARVTRPGGEVALYVWDYAGQMELIRRFWDAAVALRAGSRGPGRGRALPDLPARPLARPVRGRRPRRGRDPGDRCARPCFATSTTTGPRSSAARARRRPIACPSPSPSAPACASGCARTCRQGPTAVSR